MNFEPPRPSRPAEIQEIATPEIRRQIAAEIRKAREDSQISLEQVVAVTKINPRYLESIEKGQWTFLAPTYVKAFIKSYAAAVGAMSERLEQRLDDIFPSAISKPPYEYSYMREELQAGAGG
jgi:cytoskeletal protein RodZ